MTNKEQLTKLKELKEKVERDIIESKTLAETLMFTILYRAIEEEYKELELKIEEENKPTLEEIRLKAIQTYNNTRNYQNKVQAENKPTIEEIRLESISKELSKLDIDNMSCGGVSCIGCMFNNDNNDCLIDLTEQAHKRAKEYLTKIENK